MRVNRTPIKDTKFTSYELIEGVAYIHRVIALNKIGEGKSVFWLFTYCRVFEKIIIFRPSKETLPVVCCDSINPPCEPRNPEVAEILQNSISLVWEKPDDTEEFQILGYFIEMKKVCFQIFSLHYCAKFCCHEFLEKKAYFKMCKIPAT